MAESEGVGRMMAEMNQMVSHDLFVGIDPGVNTGVAVWNKPEKRFWLLKTMKIHEAINYVKELNDTFENILVIFEDARKRNWFGETSAEKWQGAGSIKRDCHIWQDFLEQENISYEMRKPARRMTKWSPEYFKTVTGYKGRTSEHARDAAVLVFGK